MGEVLGVPARCVWRRVLALGSMGLSEEVEGRWGWIEYEYRPSG